GLPGGENPAGCHWNARPLPGPARCAAARTAGILRVLETSLTSTSAWRGRPVSIWRSARARPPTHTAEAGAIGLYLLRRHESGHRRGRVAKAATAHVSFVMARGSG